MTDPNKNYQLENMAKNCETPEIYDNLKSHRGTIGYEALSIAFEASQQRNESLLGKALDLVRDYTSLNGMTMPNNLPAELYLNLTFNEFTKRKKSSKKRNLEDKCSTLGTVRKNNRFRLNHF
ncbi:hypothetical protein HON71_00350 [Candidatus Woesearchaeota archaeon]|jgi:hypothetical protein|nr:hypothetical protein [Candidatus Woesearchaeota archaeon]MBT5342118.1 hypothetical protein [Candidatus Woesearchaeota archaeon]